MVVAWAGVALVCILASAMVLVAVPAVWGREGVVVAVLCGVCLGCWALAWRLIGVMVAATCGGGRLAVVLGGNRWCSVGVSAGFGQWAPWLW